MPHEFHLAVERPELLKPATETDVREASERLGWPLPPSYVAFVRTYGFGRLGELIRILSPGPDAEGLLTFAPALLERLAVTEEAGLDQEWTDDDRELAHTMTPFGYSDNGHVLGFGGPTIGDERRIVVFGANGEVRYDGGSTFQEFIERLFDDRVRQTLGPGYRPLSRVFVPAGAR